MIETARAARAMAPATYRVERRRQETADTWTLELAPSAAGLPVFAPGQFAMLYAFGPGEAAISLSAAGPAGGLVHTVRAVGAVTRAIYAARPSDTLGARGPFGVG